jgi:hypothetical protein
MSEKMFWTMFAILTCLWLLLILYVMALAPSFSVHSVHKTIGKREAHRIQPPSPPSTPRG